MKTYNYTTDRFSTKRWSGFIFVSGGDGGGAEVEETLCIIIASATRITLCDPDTVIFLQQTNILIGTISNVVI